MSKKTGVIAIILSLLAVCLSVASLFMKTCPAKGEEKDVQYVMYLGTNDKDTNEPVFSPEEAKEKAEEILIKHFGGYTIQEASGGWIDDGTVYQEYSVVIYLSDTSVDNVHDAAKELIEKFNQSSVLIQANETKTEFYSGDN